MTGRSERPRPKRCRGFSLVELLVATILFSIMTIAVMGVYRVGVGTEAVTAQRTKLQDGLQYVLKALDHEIAEASASLSTSTSKSVAVAIPTFDADGVPTGFSDIVTFSASGSDLYQTVVTGDISNRTAFVNKRLVANLPDPYPTPGLFTFWTRTGGTLSEAPPEEATIVRVTLLQTDTYGGRRQTVRLSQDIRMRNR